MEQDTTASSSGIPFSDCRASGFLPAFVQAVRLELEQYRDVLDFQTEYRLTSEPLGVCCASRVKPQKSPARRFFTLQTPKAAHK
jgi:hypothetical protein